MQQYIVVQGSLHAVDSKSQLLESAFSLCLFRIPELSRILYSKAQVSEFHTQMINFFPGVRNSDCLTWSKMQRFIATALAARKPVIAFDQAWLFTILERKRITAGKLNQSFAVVE